MQILGKKNIIFILFCVSLHVFGQSEVTASIWLETSADALCSANPFFAFIPHFTDDGTFGNTRKFIHQYSEDKSTWNTFFISNRSYHQRTSNLKEGWYRVAVSRAGEEEMPERHLVSEPVFLQKIDGGCTPFRNPWPDEISDDVCTRGTLLFREDFGGNDPSDPVTSQERLTTMSSRYIQVFDVMTRVNSGKYIVAKHGWQNNLNLSTSENLYSQWYIQDDHTYPNDYTRGYLLEVDGLGGSDAFYSTTFPVCQEMDLSFSAYVANVLDPNNHPFTKPQVRFVIKDEETGTIIHEQSSGEIESAPKEPWGDIMTTVKSAPWRMVGASFHVPEGVNLLRLSIFNDVSAFSGNDFAMDDIEIRLCKPEVTVEGEHEMCLDSAYTFTPLVTADGGFAEPYNYLWQYAQDSLTFNSDEWTNIHHGPNLSFDAVQASDEGWYRLCVTSNGVDVETERYCRAMSEPFHLTTKECEDPSPYRHVFCDTTVCHEDSLTYRGKTYAAPGTYIDTVPYPTAKDTIYHLTITDSRSFHDVSIVITAGNPPPHPWESITEAGIYYDTLVNALGCDSIVTWYISFKERCIEPLEEHYSVCAGDTLVWHQREFVQPGDYLDTLWHSMPEACDTAVLLHLHQLPIHTRDTDIFICEGHYCIIGEERLYERGTYPIMFRASDGCDSIVTVHLDYLPSFTDTIYATITYGDKYSWDGDVWTEPATPTRKYIASNGCDSLVTLQLSVDYRLTVEQMELESGCSESEQMTLHLLLSRLVDSVRLAFSNEAREAGLRDSMVYIHAKQADISIPHRSAHPGHFACGVSLVHGNDVLYTDTLFFTLLYPASVLEQAWNDVVAVLTHDYNGGYDFVAFQWYENGEPLMGENHSYLYRPLIMGGQYSAMLTEPDGRQAMTCPLIATHQEEISLYPTVIGPQRQIRCFLAQDAELFLYDAFGRIVRHDYLPAGETVLPMPAATGVYIAAVILHNNTKPQLYKLIVR